MARRHGKTGKLMMGIATSAAAPEAVAYIKMWSGSFATDRAEGTAFGDTNKVKFSGLPDASGSFDGFFDNATAQTYTAALDGIARKFYMYPDHTNDPSVYWYGSAFFDFSVSTPIDGMVTISGTWDAAGNITKNG